VRVEVSQEHVVIAGAAGRGKSGKKNPKKSVGVRLGLLVFVCLVSVHFMSTCQCVIVYALLLVCAVVYMSFVGAFLVVLCFFCV